MPDELKQFQTPVSEKPIERPSVSQPSQSTVSQPVPEKQNSSTMFSMFNTEETRLNVSLNIKLPNKKLLKMMYENADDKEIFLSDLSQYVYSEINKDIVKSSLKKTLVPSSKKNNASTKKTTEVIVTEVKEENE